MKDLLLAKRYLRKAQSAADRGIEFTLSFTSFKNLCSAKKCYYTGVKLTDYNGTTTRGTDRTIERVDNTKGYVKGNVRAVCYSANNLKSIWENPQHTITFDMVKDMVSKLSKGEQ